MGGRWRAAWSRHLLAFSCGLLALAAPVRAEPDALTVLVRVCGARDREAFARVRGQTSDLAVRLLAHECSALEPSFERQLARAGQLAVEQRASAVVWFAEHAQEPDAWIVYVATPGDGRVLANRLPADGAGAQPGEGEGARAHGDSALLEQSALIVRFALQGLALGGTLGVERGQATTAVPAAEASAAGSGSGSGSESGSGSGSGSNSGSGSGSGSGSESESESESGSESESRGADALWLGLGYEVAADGFARAGAHGLAARVSAGFGRWEAALLAGAALPTEREGEPAGMRLQRVRLAAALALRVPFSTQWSFAGGAQAGALLLRRETLVSAGGAQATPRAAQWNAALVLGPEASVHLRSGRWGLALGAALDVLPSPTRFVLREDGAEIAAAAPARVQPRVFLTAELAP